MNRSNKETKTMTRRRSPLFFPMLLAITLAAVAFAEDTAPINVLVIGWDGAQRAHVRSMLEQDELPVLKALSTEGRLIDIDVTAGVTDTKAGWVQIFTGYTPDKTGVYSNSRYQPVAADLWVFDRVEKHIGPDNIDTVAVIGKKGHVDSTPARKIPFEQWLKQEDRQKRIDKKKPGRGALQGGRIVEENGKKFVEIPAKPWNLISGEMDLFVNGLVQNDKVTARALQELEKRKDHRFLFFVHFAEPDHAGHRFGENSAQYSEALRSNDACTAKLLAKLRELGLYEKTLVYVVVDHGFDEGLKGHKYAPFVFLGTNDPLVNRDGNRMDIAPTILKRFGVDLAALEPKLDGFPLDETAPDRKATISPPPGYEAMRQVMGPAKTDTPTKE